MFVCAINGIVFVYWLAEVWLMYATHVRPSMIKYVIFYLCWVFINLRYTTVCSKSLYRTNAIWVMLQICKCQLFYPANTYWWSGGLP